MCIKTSAVFGSLNTDIDFENLKTLGDDFRVMRNDYLKMDPCTACIFKSGKVQIYGSKDLTQIQEIWNDSEQP